MRAASNYSPGLKSDQRDLLVFLAFRHLQCGKPANAAEIYNVLAAIDCTDPTLIYALSYAYLRCGRPALALQHLDTLKPMAAHDPLIWLLRGQALSLLGRSSEASKSMRMFIRLRSAEIQGRRKSWK